MASQEPRTDPSDSPGLYERGGQAVEAVYDFYLNMGLERRYQARLLLKGSQGLFLWGKPRALRSEGAHEFHLVPGSRDSVGSYTYTDRNELRMRSRVPALRGRAYQVCEPLPEINWTLSGETTQIGPYECERASGRFRGRTYEVWFAPELPFSLGPWKLHGLPGLVVLARDEASEIVFRLNTLKPASSDFTVVPEEEKCLGIQDFARLQQEWAGEMLRRMNAKLPRGSRLSIGKQKAMERFDLE